MFSIRKSFLCLGVALACVAMTSLFLYAEPPSGVEPSQEANQESTEKADSKPTKRVTVEVARQRAKLSHNIYSATLDAMHHFYFRDDRSSVPARVLEDVFAEISDQESIEARWIAVNAKAMSIDHRPQNQFEKDAAKAIAAGKASYEVVEDGVYRRAQGISLMNKGCLGCHMGFGASGTVKRFAGLVIEIPVTKK